MYMIFTSCGNDSVAAIQLLIERGCTDIHAAYSETHWGSKEWPARVKSVADYCAANGVVFHRIDSEGFSSLCKSKRKQAFPRDGMQFCTEELKIKPALAFLEKVDPERSATCVVGVRREESAKRRQWPEWVMDSPKHGGRELWSPLVRYSTEQRDMLIKRAGLPILNHRSRECFPCVNSGKMDLRTLDQQDVDKVRILEEEMGIGKRSGKAKYMFRSDKCGGAKGIVEVIKWASHSKYIEGQDDMFGGGCDSGFCGD